jgi:hypothetical protein
MIKRIKNLIAISLTALKPISKCKHLNCTEIFRYPPDNYVELKCNDCGEIIFKDIYNV